MVHDQTLRTANTPPPDARGYLELMIKAYPKGPMSQHIHNLKPGDSLDFKGPIPKYPWTANKHAHVVLIAGGTGITPMYQLVRKITSDPRDKTKITLVFGNIGPDDILLRERFAQLEAERPHQFKAFYALEKPPPDWAGVKGYITKELLQKACPDPKEGGDVKIFVCGPGPMYKAISGPKKGPKDQGELEGILKEMGYSKDQVFKF